MVKHGGSALGLNFLHPIAPDMGAGVLDPPLRSE